MKSVAPGEGHPLVVGTGFSCPVRDTDADETVTTEEATATSERTDDGRVVRNRW
ncbi:hypothetical protein [Salinigranum halophilum]|uniref:hypothetical protein n=1 Tax=Salinigranum halophilum TaxID=2565931 RepID=UPI001375AF9E|nr:hypothetical protein [Salinigranum halophilum]